MAVAARPPWLIGIDVLVWLIDTGSRVVFCALEPQPAAAMASAAGSAAIASGRRDRVRSDMSPPGGRLLDERV
jgi:hypothetical protein